MTQLQFHAGLAMFAASTAVAANDNILAASTPSPFEEASLIVEQNATDGDTEVVIFGVAGDEGLRLLRIKSPDGRKVATLLAPDPTTLGIREFLFESPEPPGEAILAAYPEGRYVLVRRVSHRRGISERAHPLARPAGASDDSPSSP